MINQNLFRKATLLDSAAHRKLRISVGAADWSVARDLNAQFIAAVEFGDVCGEYPILFVAAGSGTDGKREVAPIAALGLKDRENLYLDPADPHKWRASYIPVLLRTYPFGVGRVDEDRVMMVIDEGWTGWSQDSGQALFDDQGQPTEYVDKMREQLQGIETEIRRTRVFCDLLVQADLLREMRFDATLPDGQKLAVDGFLTVDEKALAALPDAKVVELHRSGALGLIHAHQISLRHMRRLVEWRALRGQAAA